MNEKPKYLTVPFWAALISAGVLVAVTLGLVSSEQGAAWEEMLVGLVAAVLPILILVMGYANDRAARAQFIAENTPAWLKEEFWLTLIGTGLMILVAAQVVSQEQADVWRELLAPAVAQVLMIVTYIWGGQRVGTATTIRSLR